MGILERFRIDGKKALVTGAGRGLGKAFALALAEAGADVAIVDINKENGKETTRDIQALGRQSCFIHADVSLENESSRMVEQVLAEWGRLDIAVNNAGVSCEIKGCEKISYDDWRKVIYLNCKGTFFCFQAEAAAMKKYHYGKIINIASICGHIVWPEFQSVYSISKAGVIHTTRCLAVELIREGIRVNSISPGVTRTPELFPEVIPVFVNKAPIARIAEVADLQGAVIFLASEVSDFMVGQDLVLDGGYTLV
ncbi:MAG: SDR family oxidoreductase [Spirochaetales bacterium]|nr:MAG: SDR family oxidoreductase [Spirochaetales bacterium]